MQIEREKAVRLNFAGNVVSQDRKPQGTCTEKCWNKLSRSQNNLVLFLLEENNQKTQIVRFIHIIFLLLPSLSFCYSL